jgi:hypothetical protein
MVKYVETHALSDAETAARKLIEIANGVEAVQDGRIHIEKINGPFSMRSKARPLNISPDSNWPSREAGSYCTSPGLT